MIDTLWERRWPAGRGTSLSIERSQTAQPMSKPAWFVFALLLSGRDTGGRGLRIAHLGFMHRGRLPVGVAAFIGGKLRQRWWA